MKERDESKMKPRLRAEVQGWMGGTPGIARDGELILASC